MKVGDLVLLKPNIKFMPEYTRIAYKKIPCLIVKIYGNGRSRFPQRFQIKCGELLFWKHRNDLILLSEA
jgi:hypothetical protein